MNVEQIKRLITRVSADFRTRWENKFLDGKKTLTELSTEYDAALMHEQACRRRVTCWSRIDTPIYILSIVLFCVLFMNKQTIAAISLSVLGFAGSFALMNKITAAQSAALFKVRKIENIFERFRRSVDDLNPLQTGNPHVDVVNEEYVMDTAVSLAVRVRDAEYSVDEVCRNKSRSRKDLIKVCEWLKRCYIHRNSYNHTLAYDFTYEIDWPTAFKRAEDHLKKTRPTSE